MIKVYGVYTIRGSLLMYLGIAIFSPSIAIAQWLGAILGCLAGSLTTYENRILTMDVSPALVVGPSAYSGIYIGVWSYSALLTGHFPPLLTLFFDPRSGISFESYSSSIQPELQCTSHSRHSGVRLSHALYFSRLLKYLILVKS